MKSYNSVHLAYINSLRELINHGDLVESVTDPTSVGSTFGKKERAFVEIRGYGFILSNPRNRLIYSTQRRLSLGFCIANFFWLLSGRNDVDTISFYNKLGSVFSSNGSYYEAAFGNRIFGNYNLWSYAFELLKKDRNTRRALIPIFIPDDLKTLPLDTPCASSVQILERNGKVDFFLHMRSQSAAMVFPYDIFLFTMLHEFIGQLIGLPLGNFHYYCNSFHYYKEEENKVKEIIKADSVKDVVCMPIMPKTSWDNINEILKAEESFRQAIIKGSKLPSIQHLKLNEYWKDLLMISILKGCEEHNVAQEHSDPIYLSSNNLYI